MKPVSTKLLSLTCGIAALAGAACPSRTQTVFAASAAAPPVALITPAQWLQRQPKPIFKKGHTMPRLTRYGWGLSLESQVEFAENWNYVLQTGYLTDETVKNVLSVPESIESKMVALTLSNPKKYPLGVIVDRSEPPSPAPETFLRDAAGKLMDGQNIYSPLNPQAVLDQMAELRARPLRMLRAKVPINIILNGGEYGLGVLGFMQKQAERDPKVVAAKGESDWFSFLSKAKARERQTIADAVRKAVPDRNLYIYYGSGNVERNRYGGWSDWGYDDTYALNATDLPSNEYYYKHFNSGYLPDAGGNDLLTRALDAVGFQIAHNKNYSYDWLSPGWVDEADAHGNPLPAAAPKPAASAQKPQLQEGNAAALVDPNAGQLSPMTLYAGFLKCLFTGGMLGGNAGYYAFPIGGFDGSFPAAKPAHYLPQMTTLSQVQALFSYLEDDLHHSDLLPGPNQHIWSKDQPAYEFATGSSGVRVLARKHRTKNLWLITAWAADGVERPVKVVIPQLGEVTLLARAAGSVYTATLQNKQPHLTLTDPDAMTPTAKGFAPPKVTPA